MHILFLFFTLYENSSAKPAIGNEKNSTVKMKDKNYPAASEEEDEEEDEEDYFAISEEEDDEEEDEEGDYAKKSNNNTHSLGKINNIKNPDENSIISQIDLVNYELSKSVDDFLEEESDKKQTLIPYLAKFTKNVEEIKETLERKDNVN
jgi:hypothetical protein